ncbi:hypothetical protein IPF86_03820 [Candidatus Nomurabacteria bacterium]|nr:MAG: hypothetical protein IPF86_03820 [Candidatus Nomurabacteria bacterium]
MRLFKFLFLVLVISVCSVIITSYGLALKTSNQSKFNLLLPIENFATIYLPFLNLELSSANNAVLSQAGIITATNKARLDNGLSILVEDSKLDVSAQIKVADMLAKQYFEHESPDGKGVSDLATEVGYAYTVIGENLALGSTFKNDEDVVTAWMNSPGHRANILNDTYTNIGVGVAKGAYQDSMVWVLVQHFGKPLALCPSADPALKEKIESEEATIAMLVIELDNEKGSIASMNQNSIQYWPAVENYNKKVTEYNALVAQVKIELEKYNSDVRKFNSCIM